MSISYLPFSSLPLQYIIKIYLRWRWLIKRAKIIDNFRDPSKESFFAFFDGLTVASRLCTISFTAKRKISIKCKILTILNTKVISNKATQYKYKFELLKILTRRIIKISLDISNFRKLYYKIIHASSMGTCKLILINMTSMIKTFSYLIII